jgi:predicted nucleic acid-binding protein
LAVRNSDRGSQALNAYLDSSALCKLLLDEPGSREVRELWAEADQIACVTIGYVEVRATIARRLSGRGASRARRQLNEYWQAVVVLAVDDDLVDRAARVADVHRLRALDALHLAAAKQSRDRELVFATWDDELRRAAQNAGLATIP